MRIKVRHAEHLKVRQAAMILTAVSILRDGVAVTSVEAAQRVVTPLWDISLGDKNAATELQRMGESLLVGSGIRAPTRDLHALILYSLLQQSPTEPDLELRSLTSGSTVGVIKDLAKEVGSRLFRVLSAAKELLPRRDGREFYTMARKLVEETNMSQEAGAVAAGQLIVGGSLLRTSFASMKARGFDVENTGEDDIAERGHILGAPG